LFWTSKRERALFGTHRAKHYAEAVTILMSNLTAHKAIARNRNGIDWLCGDLHGQYDALQMTRPEVGFNSSVDRIFLLVDVIDRGPKSKELLNWVPIFIISGISLQKSIEPQRFF